MNCKEIHNKIPHFIRNELSDLETIAFLRHIKDCKECYEETEIMNMIEMVDASLHEQEIDHHKTGYNFSNAMTNLMRERKKRICLHFFIFLVLFLMIIAGIIVASILLLK